MTDPVAFHVRGTPRPQGSLTSWRTAEGTRARIAHAGGVPFLRWRARITTDAMLAMAAQQSFKGPVVLSLTFCMPRPGGMAGRRTRPQGTPDLDKLVRCVLDALTGVVYPDDALVVDLRATKVWATELHPEGVTIEVAEINGNPYPEPDNPYPGS